MKVQVFGAERCAKCKNVFDTIQAFLDRHGIKAEMEHVKDLGKLAEAGILMTPGVVVDGKVVSQGKVPVEEDLKKWFSIS